MRMLILLGTGVFCCALLITALASNAQGFRSRAAASITGQVLLSGQQNHAGTTITSTFLGPAAPGIVSSRIKWPALVSLLMLSVMLLRRRKRRSFVVFLVLIGTGIAFASSLVATSDISGSFVLTNVSGLETGIHKLEFFHHNYTRAVRYVTVTATSQDPVVVPQVVLSPIAMNPDEDTPDPPTDVPDLDPSSWTDFEESTKFIYEGNDPLQVDVTPGTIDHDHAAVLRGRVLGPDEKALPGVSVSVLGHSELGYTLTRVSGAYDLAVNGSNELAVQFDKQGYAPAQRTIQVKKLRFVRIPDVRMLPYDTHVTTIDTSGGSGMQLDGRTVNTLKRADIRILDFTMKVWSMIRLT